MIGKTIPRYGILEYIGGGRMSIAYKLRTLGVIHADGSNRPDRDLP